MNDVRRRTITRAAWTMPLVAAAVPAPALAVSCQGQRQLVGTYLAPSPGLLTYTPKLTSRATYTDPATGITWMRSVFADVIKNVSGSTITDLVMVQPFLGLAYTNMTNYHPMVWSDSEQLWLSPWLTTASNPAYTNPLEPHTEYVLSLRDLTGNLVPSQPYTDFAAWVPTSFTFAVGTATIASTDHIQVLTPAATTLAPGASTTIEYATWREYNAGAYAGYDGPDYVIGTVMCP